MSDDRVVILCTGDLHLGRYPSRVPPNRRDLSVAHIWKRTVDFAIERAVDLVALTGDVADRANRFFEAVGPLEEGVRRLAAHGISTFAVSGNHDFDVLPRLVDAVGAEHFHLLGRDGAWESRLFERDGRPVLRLVGWSFPHQHFPHSPLAVFVDELAAIPDDSIPTVGLLHADLDQTASKYAPVSSAELGAQPVAAWLLGHIHRPTQTRSPGGNLILYPGSPQPLDPGEQGAHGPWLVEVEPGRPAAARQVPLASVRYLELELDLSGIEDAAAFEQLMLERIRGRMVELARESKDSADALRPPEYLSFRLRLVGRTRVHRELERISDLIIADLKPSVAGISARIDKVELATRPDVDLREIARGSDPPALLARLLIALDETPDERELPPQYRPLFAKLRGALGDVHRANAFNPLLAEGLASAEVDRVLARRYVQVEGLRLLEQLLAQKNASSDIAEAAP
jgi:DNA repair exonuclease SbcCD nuclease subunit